MSEDNPGALRLRAGRPSDFELMYQMDADCFEPPFRFPRSALRRFTEEPGSFTIVAECAGLMAGFVICQMNDVAEKECYIVTLDVAPALRRQGVARRLVTAAEAEAKRRGASRMTLHAWTQNVAAIELYERSGFERLQFHPDLYAPGLSGIGFGKRIEA